MMEVNTINDAFEAQVAKTPDKVAVCDENRRLTYRQLNQLANSIASRFPMKSQFVGLVMDHSVEMIAALLAILKSGAAYVPIDSSYSPRRIRYIMNQCDISFVVTQKKCASLFQDATLVFVESGEPILDIVENIKDPVLPEMPAYVQYTSGTTGFPKGVIVEHRNVGHYVGAFCYEFQPSVNDVMLQNSVATFDTFVEEVFPTLLTGGTLAIPGAATKNDFTNLLEFIAKHNVTIVSGLPYLLLQLNKLEHLPESLRLLISGGEVLREEYVSNLLDKVEVYNTYGTSETTVCAAYFRCNDASPLEDGTFPVGKEVRNVSIALLDETLNSVKPGEIGEICIFGDGISRGYLNNDEEMHTFVRTLDGLRFYRSGDLGRWLPDGNLAFLKRKDDQQVMIMGRRVEPKEVENALGQCQLVQQGIVAAHMDETGFSYLIAYIVPNSKNLSLSEVRSQLSERLPNYMIPEYFIILEQMPTMPNGKVDRRALPVVLKEGGMLSDINYKTSFFKGY